MRTHKHPDVAINRKRPALLFLGMMGALSCTLMAFEYRTPYEEVELFSTYIGEIPSEVIIIPVTRREEPKPKPPETMSVMQELILTDIDIPEPDPDPDPEPIPPVDEPFDSDSAIADIGFDDEYFPPEEPLNGYELDQMPSFPGGDSAMFSFLSMETRYPTLARESRIDGVVYVGFVIEKDGSVSDVEVLRGVGGGCDEEAVRVVKSMPAWTAGMQRGHKVRVRYQLPYRFKLQ